MKLKKIDKILLVVLLILLVYGVSVVYADLTGTEGLAIDLSSAGAGTDFTIAFDPTEFLGSRTWGDGSTDTIVWTWNRATGTDPTITFNSGSIALPALTLTTDLADGDVANNITIDLATLATTLTITDNEATAENNPIVFVAGGDLDGGNLGLESDGTCYYTPSTGIITTTGFAGALTGNVTGDTSGSSGSCTGNAATATVGTTVTITDNEDTAENNPIVFVAGADPDGGNLGLETDGDTHYNPSTGTITATEFVGGGSGLTLASTDLTDTADLLYETELDDFSELDAQIADKALINLADGGTFTGNIIANGNLSIGNAATTAGVLTLLEDDDDGANFASFMVPALAANTVYTLPSDDGGAGEQLQTNGSGALTWESAGGIPTTITVADESADDTCFVGFFTAATGDLGPKSGSNITFASSSGTLAATQFSGGGASLTTVDAATGDSATDFFDAGEIADARISNTLTSSSCTGNAATVTGATLTTALTVDTGTLTLTANGANNSVLTIGAGASSVSGANTGDNTDAETGDSATAFFDAGTIEHERGGIEADISAIADGGMLVGTGAGTMAIRASALTGGAAGFIKHEIGGLEADINAYTGLVAITGGSTAEVDSLDELEGQLADVTRIVSEAVMPVAATDPDVDAQGELSVDTDGANEPNDVTLRVTDTGGDTQYALAQVQKSIQCTIIKPNDLADATRDCCPIWSNETGMTFTITKIEAWSDTDDTSVNVEVYDSIFGNNATVDALEIAGDGTANFYVTETTITAATIVANYIIVLDFDDTDDPGWVKVSICGYFNADVD